MRARRITHQARNFDLLCDSVEGATLTHINGLPYFDPFVITKLEVTKWSAFFERKDDGIPLVTNATDVITIRFDR